MRIVLVGKMLILYILLGVKIGFAHNEPPFRKHGIRHEQNDFLL